MPKSKDIIKDLNCVKVLKVEPFVLDLTQFIGENVIIEENGLKFCAFAP